MYRFALPEGPVRSASRGSPAAKSIRLALRTSSIVETRSANFVRWVLRCFGRRRLSSELRLSAISLMPVMMRFQVPSRAQSLNHKPIPHVNSLASKPIDGKGNKATWRLQTWAGLVRGTSFTNLLPDRPSILSMEDYKNLFADG